MTERENIGIYDVGDVYDAIYGGRGKDYRAEATAVTGHIRARRPGAASILDVGCGTGRHLRYFAEDFTAAEGIDLTEGMLDVARRHLKSTPLHTGDMRSFELGRRFDAVVSLFCVIGNLVGQDELDATLTTFARHLNPGGVVVIEPWWFPENFTPDHVGGSLTTVDGRTVSRVSHTVREREDASRMDVHYLVAEPGRGVQHFTDTHVLSLYGREQFARAYERAGLSVEYVEGDYEGNGLFIGVKRGEA
ncbi:methyltransferase domain-containing protein [Streptomyces sp. P9(2023)]|uniref:class I SAM-dependent DNA methyltransferase n=1 Tax=Streptomyces sp. P9(2023) TaxID=3064394 RepID=UPI0028F40524|nr:methyltransferase domain-containing protein [Streptomyces sp. P9(2023)]MDT9693692.1 methyltransferase domain-containing protein [Streptomyces sp. P9(2023)]